MRLFSLAAICCPPMLNNFQHLRINSAVNLNSAHTAKWPSSLQWRKAPTTAFTSTDKHTHTHTRTHLSRSEHRINTIDARAELFMKLKFTAVTSHVYLFYIMHPLPLLSGFWLCCHPPEREKTINGKEGTRNTEQKNAREVQPGESVRVYVSTLDDLPPSATLNLPPSIHFRNSLN